MINTSELMSLEKITLLIDTSAFNNLMVAGDRVASAILGQVGCKHLQFCRSPVDATNEELSRVDPIQFLLDEDGQTYGVRIQNDRGYSDSMFRYEVEYLSYITNKVYGTRRTGSVEHQRLLLFLVHRQLNLQDMRSVMITDDSLLLKKRPWMSHKVSSSPICTMSVDEASQFLDLFLKHKGLYRAWIVSFSKNLWYWYSMRLKLPHYHTGSKYLDATAAKFEYVLMALDELGTQYYLGADHGTQMDALYHFSYFISLASGILDNLALAANDRLSSPIRMGPEISLRSGSDFVKALKREMHTLHDHVRNHRHLINIIYLLRDPILHREGLRAMRLMARDKHLEWEVNTVQFESNVIAEIKSLMSGNQTREKLTEWGFRDTYDSLADPFHFSKKMAGYLREFTDRYIELLGFSSFIDSQKSSSDEFSVHLRMFEELHLGF